MKYKFTHTFKLLKFKLVSDVARSASAVNEYTKDVKRRYTEHNFSGVLRLSVTFKKKISVSSFLNIRLCVNVVRYVVSEIND